MCGEIDGVDVHAHCVPPQFMESVKKSGLGGVKVEGSRDKFTVTFPGAEPLRPITGVMVDFKERLTWMDGQGMRQQLIAPWLDVHGQELPAAQGQEWVRQLNDAMAEQVSGSGGRLLAYATLHLADAKAAARELERAHAKLKMTGSMLPTFFPQGDLSESRYDAVWEAAQSLDIPIVLHPTTDSPSACMFGSLPKLKGLYGRPIDTTVIATQLITTGVFDRFPKLRLVLVHGGGFLPYQAGRFDREHTGPTGMSASDYIRKFYYDTVLMSAPALKLLFELVGTGQVMIGSDYAATSVERKSPKLTSALDATGIDAASRRKVVHETATAIFKTARVS
jgi:aminocarboxymuconate-semialdehyde decarboxylase